MNALYRKYRQRSVFRKEDILRDFPQLSADAINKKIEDAKRKSRVIKSVGGRRGIYYVVEPGESYVAAHPDPLLLATNLANGAIICYASALMLLGKSHSSLNIMYISSSSRFRDLTCQGMKYHYVVLPEREIGLETFSHRGTPLIVTTLERTLIDCLGNLKYAGGFEQFYRSYEGVSYINWRTLEQYLKVFSSPLLNARVGLFVELQRERWNIPEVFFARLRRNLPKYPDYFLGRKEKAGKLNANWNLIVAEEVMHIGGRRAKD